MTVVVYIIAAYIWIAAWVQYSLLSMQMMYVLVTNPGSKADKITLNKSWIIVGYNSNERHIIGSNEVITRNKMIKAERASRLIAMGKEMLEAEEIEGRKYWIG